MPGSVHHTPDAKKRATGDKARHEIAPRKNFTNWSKITQNAVQRPETRPVRFGVRLSG